MFLSDITIAMAESGGNANLFQALGIDWRLLLLQAGAFLVLVLLLGKFAYPPIIKAIDKRQEQLDAGAKASEEAQKRAEQAESEIAKRMRESREQADQIVATAHKEAADMVAEAEKKAETRAEHIVSEARSNIENDVAAAREALRGEMAQLVALATEKVIGEKLDDKKDAALIERSLKESRG